MAQPTQTFVVDNAASQSDTLPGTLEYALTNARAGDTIQFQVTGATFTLPHDYALPNGTLTFDTSGQANGEAEPGNAVTIAGGALTDPTGGKASLDVIDSDTSLRGAENPASTPGVLTLAHANSYTGATTVGRTGTTGVTLRGGMADAFAPASVVALFGQDGGLVVTSLDLGGYDQQIGSLSDVTGSNVGQEFVLNSGPMAATLTVGGDNTSASFAGHVQDGETETATFALALDKVGTGTQTLRGSDSYTGGTTVSGGVLDFANDGAVPNTGSITFGSGQAGLELDAVPENGQTFKEALDSFSLGDTLDLRGLAYASGATATASDGVLTVTSGDTSERFTLIAPGQAVYAATPDMDRGVLVTAIAVPMPSGGSGDTPPAGGTAGGGGVGTGAAGMGCDCGCDDAVSGGQPGSPVSSTPTSGRDSLTVPIGGTVAALAGDDTVVGGGFDLIAGNQGCDLITVGNGPNTVVGGMGCDTVTAGNGSDVLLGNEGCDVITAGDGSNTVFGGMGCDTVTAGNGANVLLGNQGNDVIAAGNGSNIAFGGMANDVIVVGDGANLLLGNEGNDAIAAGAGRNTVFGGMGDDRITVGRGGDLIFGGEGVDTITAGNGNNTVVGGTGYAVSNSVDGADLIVSGGGNDLILGNGGDDTVAAGGGADTVVGGFGRDILLGNQGDDIVLGNQGDDTLFGGFGDDTLVGGQGNDVLYGNQGDDVLYGNEGLNTFVFNPGDTDFKSGVSTGDVIMDFATGTSRIDFASGPAGTATDFGTGATTAKDFASAQALAQALINGGDAYAFVANGTDGYLFTTGGTGTAITDAIKLAGAGTAGAVRYTDIAHGALA